MESHRLTKEQVILLVGDVLVIAIVVLFGLLNHGELNLVGGRLWPNLIPMVAAWLLAMPLFGLFDPHVTRNPRQIWRPIWAMVFVAPLGAWLRGVWLNSAILPIFVLVMGGIIALALFLWRALFMVWMKQH